MQDQPAIRAGPSELLRNRWRISKQALQAGDIEHDLSRAMCLDARREIPRERCQTSLRRFVRRRRRFGSRGMRRQID